MKIGLICSHGGHLTEMQCILKAFEGHDIFVVTYESPRTQKIPCPKYLMANIGTNPLKMGWAFFRFIKIFQNERPDIIVSTGSEIAIPAFYLAKLFRIRTIFIESWCRVTTTSGTGRIVYPVANIFLVQWPELLKLYGKKAQFKGAVV